MDWIDNQTATETKKRKSASGKLKRSMSLEKRMKAVLANPVDVWAAGFEHELAAIQWPEGCDAALSWLWSTVILEQAQVLCRAGVSPSRLAGALNLENNGNSPAQLSTITALMSDALESRAFSWLDEADCYPQAALGIIATLWHLPDHARRVAPDQLAQWLQAVAIRTVEHSSQQSECLLGNLVFHCELPLLLDLLTASPKFAAGNLASQAMDDLAEYLENSQEHIGSWLAHGATYLRAALACVLRCRLLANHLGLRKWYSPQRKALSGLLIEAARWTRPDGTELLGSGLNRKSSQAMWKALSKLASGSREQRQPLILSKLLRAESASTKKATESRLPDISVHDEHAGCALLGSSWLQPGSRVAIDFSDTDVQVEVLGPKGRPLISGNWPVQVSKDGRALYQLDGWEQVCWFSDNDVSYLEIESRFGDSVKFQRQFVLFRQHRLLLVADALLGDQCGQWKMSSEISLAPETAWLPNEKNTEAFLGREKAHCLVLPLFLPEWKNAPASGQVNANSDRLEISNSCNNACRLYSPVLFALCNRFSHKPYTWRHLSVAENLRIVGRDEALGLRVQLGKLQLLLYRSLTPTTRRTVLGTHLLSDFFAGLFDKDSGEAATLVEIEGTE